MPFAQVLMGRGVCLNIDPVITHVTELFPRDRFPAAQCAAAHAFGVNKHCERIAVLLHNRPRDFVLRFPAIIEGNDSAARRYVFLAPLPGEQILH